MEFFEKIISTVNYPFLNELSKKNNISLGCECDEENNSFIFSGISEDSDNFINGALTDGNIDIYITNNDSEIIERFNKSFKNENELKEILEDSFISYSLLNKMDVGVRVLTEDEEKDNKDNKESEYSDIPDGLNKLFPIVEDVARKTKELSELTDDSEIITVILSLSNDLYSLSIDMQNAIDTYKDILQSRIDEQMEELESESNELEESSKKKTEMANRIKIAESVLAVKKLNKSGVISNRHCEEYSRLCNEIFKK